MIELANRPLAVFMIHVLSTDKRGKAEKVGVVQPGEEKAPGTPYSSLPVPEGGLQESWRGTFYKDV